MRHLRILALLLVVGAPSLRSKGATTTSSAPTTIPVRQITIGNSVAVLDGQWKFHTGDNMQWAQPKYDDSAWATMDLTPPKGSYDPIIGSSGFVPGWTARGYPGYSGYAWYRLRVNIQNSQTSLALKMPSDFDDIYQIYVNGRLIGQFGRFTAHGVTAYLSQPQAFPLPANFRGGLATIAIRMWMAADLPLLYVNVGGLHGPPVLGQQATIASLLRIDWDANDRSYALQFAEMAILLLALLVAFALFWLDRSEPAYLWLGLVCTAMLALSVQFTSAHYVTWIGSNPQFLLQDAVLIPLTIGLWVVFWSDWFRLPHMGRIHRTVWSLVVLLAIGTVMLRTPVYGTVVPVHAAVWLTPLTETLKLLLGLVLVWVTVRGIRSNKFEGWLALPAVVLVAISGYQVELLALQVPVVYFLFGFGIELDQIAAILSLLIVTVLMLRRYLHNQREREQWKLEIEQARQVQSLLLPNIVPATPGFAIESVYRPAQQVGGDFFHLRPAEDGSLLVVVGDVSGKGLKAAMTVSAIIGALRGCSSRAPAGILTYLNAVLHGQVQGFATCCVCLIATDGGMAIANAGHIPPYRNGEEMTVGGGLPLGVISYVDYEQTTFHLAPGDRLTFVSDGVIEATNSHRELFGFDRTRRISNRAAVDIADAAQTFGQQDDITVVSVVFEPDKVAQKLSTAFTAIAPA